MLFYVNNNKSLITWFKSFHRSSFHRTWFLQKEMLYLIMYSYFKFTSACLLQFVYKSINNPINFLQVELTSNWLCICFPQQRYWSVDRTIFDLQGRFGYAKIGDSALAVGVRRRGHSCWSVDLGQTRHPDRGKWPDQDHPNHVRILKSFFNLYV